MTFDDLDEDGVAARQTSLNPHSWLSELARSDGRTLQSLRAMHANNDPFCCGTPAHLRDGEWFAAAWRDHVATRAHLRRLHYLLVTEERIRPNGEPYVNTFKVWQWMLAASRIARDLELIDAGDLEDRRSSDIATNAVAPERQYLPWPPQTSVSTFSARVDVASTDEDLSTVWCCPPDLSLSHAVGGYASVDGYDMKAGDDEPYRVAVIIEKSTVDDVLGPLCSRLGIDYLPATGYMSNTRARELLLRDDRPLRVLYISDYDHAGKFMPRAVARRLEFLLWRAGSERDVALQPLALTRDQVAKYDLPSTPDNGATELDALVALRPGVLQRLVSEAASEWADINYRSRLSAARDVARAAVAPVFAPFKAQLDAIAETVNQEAEQPRADFKEAMRHVAETVNALQAEVEAAQEHLGEQLAEINRRHAAQIAHIVADAEAEVTQIELPPRPEPAVPGDAGKWLYNSDRDYLEQIDAYRAAENRFGSVTE